LTELPYPLLARNFVGKKTQNFSEEAATPELVEKYFVSPLFAGLRRKVRQWRWSDLFQSRYSG
jgi:hypothetical protein